MIYQYKNNHIHLQAQLKHKNYPQITLHFSHSLNFYFEGIPLYASLKEQLLLGVFENFKGPVIFVISYLRTPHPREI